MIFLLKGFNPTYTLYCKGVTHTQFVFAILFFINVCETASGRKSCQKFDLILQRPCIIFSSSIIRPYKQTWLGDELNPFGWREKNIVRDFAVTGFFRSDLCARLPRMPEIRVAWEQPVSFSSLFCLSVFLLTAHSINTALYRRTTSQLMM